LRGGETGGIRKKKEKKLETKGTARGNINPQRKNRIFTGKRKVEKETVGGRGRKDQGEPTHIKKRRRVDNN